MYAADDFDYTWQGFTPYPSIDEGVLMQRSDIFPGAESYSYDSSGIYLPFMPSQSLDREYNYMKQLYPDEAMVILREAENEADRMDYAGSPIYDEYPDKETLLMAVNRIYERVKEPLSSLQTSRIENEDGAPPNEDTADCRCADSRFIIYLIQVIYYNEILRRRRKRRR